MTKRQKRLVAIALILFLLLALLGGYFYFYKRTKKLNFRVTASTEAFVAPPEFLFSFSGEGGDRLQRPIDVLVDDGTVYVTDSVRARVFTFTESGRFKGSFGASQTTNPLYLAKNPKDGLIYVSDRERYTILKFTTEGRFVGEFKPDLPKAELPDFETGGVQWAPIAVAFAGDGTMFVTEILNGHRLLAFTPQGRFIKDVGDSGSVADPTQGTDLFQFPNGLMVMGDEVYVADSNNQRIKVYSKSLAFKRVIVTGGLPRGLGALGALPGDTAKSPKRFVQSDTLSHDAVLWTTQGKEILKFGEQGILDGQFSYPGGVAVGTRNRIFVADTSNGRVQAWGWPIQEAGLSGLSEVATGNSRWLCLSPLLLLLLPLGRKKRFFATADFVAAVMSRDELKLLPGRRRMWITTQADYEVIRTLDGGDVDLAALFEPVAFSESDVNALMSKYDFDRDTAIVLATADRARVAGIEGEQELRLAKVMELNVFSAADFAAKFGPRK